MHQQITNLYIKYNETLRPLVSEIEGRNEYFEEPLLINVASMFDNIALSDTNNDENDSLFHLNQADSDLNLCISQSYQYLIKNLDEKMKAFEKRCNASDLNLLDNGKFIGKYESFKEEAKNHVRSGLKKDDIEALHDYHSAYNLYSKIEKLIDRELPVQVMRNTRKVAIKSTIIRDIFSILVSVIIGCLANRYGDALIEWFKIWINV